MLAVSDYATLDEHGTVTFTRTLKARRKTVIFDLPGTEFDIWAVGTWREGDFFSVFDDGIRTVVPPQEFLDALAAVAV